MKVNFVCRIDARIPDSTVHFEKRLESNNPEILLDALRFTNGNQDNIPTVEKLLNHLFVKGAAYCKENFIIYIE